MNVGFIGLGRMGSGCCSNIIAKGHRVVVYDLAAGAMQAFRGRAQLARNANEVFEETDVTILSLPGYPEVEAVTAGFLEKLVQGKGVIDISTSSPVSSRRIHERFKAAGGRYLDAPLTGTPAMAAEGTLVVNVGGDVEDYTYYKPLIESFAKTSHYIGPAGSGNIAKLVSNYLAIMYEALYAECFPLAEKAGCDVAKLFEIISDSGVNCGMYQNTVPKMCIRKTFDRGFLLDYCLKDLSYFKLLFDEHKAPSLLLDAGINLFKLGHALGLGQEDASAVAKVSYNNLGLDV